MKSYIVFTGLIPVIILIVIGFLVKYKKAYWLISGYNMMSDEKKKNVDVAGLAGFAGNLCFAIAGIFVASSIMMFFKMEAMAGIIFALLLPVVIYALIKMQKFDANARDSEGKMKTRTKVFIGSVAAFFILVSAGVGVLLHFSNVSAEYSLQSGILKISGMYGQEIPVSTIDNVELKDTIPEILYKSNGSALGTMYKGYFKLEGIGQAKVFFDSSKPPFIFFTSGNVKFVINCKDSKMTKELYNKLLDSLK